MGRITERNRIMEQIAEAKQPPVKLGPSLPSMEGIKSAGTSYMSSLDVGLSNLGGIMQMQGSKIKQQPTQDENSLRLLNRNKEYQKYSQKAGENIEKFGKFFKDTFAKSSQERIESPSYKQELQSFRDENGNFRPATLLNLDRVINVIAGGSGSMTPTLVAGLAAGPQASIAMGMLSEKGDALSGFTQALAEEKGVSPEDLSKEDMKKVDEMSSYYGVIAGILESYTPLKFLKVPGAKQALTKSFFKMPLKVMKSMVMEGGTEGIQRFSQNLIAKTSGIDPNSNLFEGVLDEAIAGALLGLPFGAMEAGKTKNIVKEGTQQTVVDPMTKENQTVKEAITKTYKTSIANEDLNYGDLNQIEGGKLKQGLVDGRVSDVRQKLELYKLDKQAKKYTKEMEGQTFKDYFEFDKKNREVLSKIIPGGEKLEVPAIKVDGVAPVESKEKSEEEISKEFKDAYSVAPENVQQKTLDAINSKLTNDDIISLPDRDAAMLGAILNTAKEREGANIDIIDANIKAIQDNGVEIPGITPVETEVTATIEKPAETKTLAEKLPEKPVVKETVVKEVAKTPEIKKTEVPKIETKEVKFQEKDTTDPKNYKTADEFVKAQGKDTLKSIAKNKAQLTAEIEKAKQGYGQMGAKLTKKQSQAQIDASTSYLKIYDRYEQEANQLTDIWNKANKKPKSKTKYQKKEKTSAEYDALKVEYKQLQKVYDDAPTAQAKKRYNKRLASIARQMSKYQEKGGKTKNLSDKEVREQVKRIPFFKNLTVKQVNKILTPKGKEAWGSYRDALIKFVNNPKETTLPHEAGHAFIDMVYTEEQKQALYDEVRKYKNDKTLSDFQAEEFAVELMAKRFVKKGKPQNKLAKMIDWLATKLKMLVNKADQIDILLSNITSEKGAKLVSAAERFKEFKGETKFQEKDEMSGFQNAVADIVSEFQTAQAGRRTTQMDEEGYKTGSIAEGSTFPKWISEELRSKDLFDKVIGKFLTDDFTNLTAPASSKQRALFDEIVSEIESRSGILIPVTEPVKKIVTAKGRLSIKETFEDVWTRVYGFAPDATMANLMEKDSAKIAGLMAQKGFSKGKQVAWTKARGKLRAKLWQQKQKFKVKKKVLLRKVGDKELNRKNLRLAVKQLLSDLPLKVQRKILSQMRVFDIKNKKHLTNILNSIEVEKKKELIRKERADMQAKVIALIHSKNIKKTENLQKAWKFPTVRNMSMDQLTKFEEVMKKAEINDIFLTQRQLETVKNTELEGIKTLREGKIKLSEKLGVPVSDLNNISVGFSEGYKFDALLAEQHPFYKALIEDLYAEQLQAEERTLNAEKNINKLIGEARRSRKRSVIDYLIPTDKFIFNYLESNNKEELAKLMTPEELKAAEYIAQEFEAMRDYLVANDMMGEYRKNYMTHIRRGFLETFKDDGFVKAWGGVFEQQKENEATFKIVSETDEILPLEKFFQFAMRREGGLTPSKNIARSFMMYKKTFETKRALDAIMPMFDVYVSALSPQETTEKGKMKDETLKKFYNEWMNNKKGRRTTIARIAQGSKVDIFLRGVKTLTTLLDLGGAVPIGVASVAGEEVVTTIALGPVKMAKGSARMATKKGQKIIKDNRAFVGKEVMEDLTEASDDAVDKAQKGLFILFRVGNLLANKQFLLGSLTNQEFESGKVSPERIAEIKRQMGRWRVVEGSGSIMGSTSVGKLLTQYKTWAVPPLLTSVSNLKYVAKNLKRGSIKSSQAMELYRAAAITTTIAFLISAAMQSDDEDETFQDKLERATKIEKGDSFLVQVQKKAIRESLTMMQALDARMFLVQPRAVQFFDNLINGLVTTAKVEKYEQTKKGSYKEGDLKGPKILYRTLTPGLLRQINLKKEDKKIIIK